MQDTRRGMVAVVLLVLRLLSGAASAEEAVVQMEQANQAYRNGDFAKAAEIYNQILSQGYESPELYYNLGNSYYKMDRIPEAVLNYERAARLDPNDEDIRNNLTHANLRVTDRIDALPELFVIQWWHSYTNLFAANTWAILSIAGIWLGLASTAIYFVIGHFLILRRALVALAVFGLSISVLAAAGALQRFRAENDRTYAILIAASTSVKSAPGERSTDLFVLHEGVKLRVLDAVGDWRKIRLADGKIGWIPVTSFEQI